MRHGRRPPRQNLRAGPRNLARSTGRGHEKDARRAGHPGPRPTDRRVGRTLPSCQCVSDTSSMTRALATPRKYRGTHHATKTWMNLREAGGAPTNPEEVPLSSESLREEGSRGVPNTNQSGRSVTMKNTVLLNDKCTRRVTYTAQRALAVKAKASSAAPPDTWTAFALPSHPPGASGSTTSGRFCGVWRWAVGWRRAFSTPLSRSVVVPARRLRQRATSVL